MEGTFGQLDGHEQVVFGHDADSGLRCIIAIHSTALGPGLGGTRCMAYPDEASALTDVLRLSRAMTFKAACAGLDLGGGKAVIIGDPAEVKSEAALRAYGRMVDSLNGRYVTACDVGTTPTDMAVIRRETRWATGAVVEEGGSGDSGVPTALGTYVGIKAAAAHRWGDDNLGGRHVAVQGVGKVGRVLCEHLHGEGVKLTVADANPAATAWAAERLGADVVAPDEIHAVACDVFSPNALGAVLNEQSIGELRCEIVAGAANNQLAEVADGKRLTETGILYAPDYVINAGGLIAVGDELHPDGYDARRVEHRVRGVGDRLRSVFTLAETEHMTTAEAAEEVGRRRIAEIGRLRGIWLPQH